MSPATPNLRHTRRSVRAIATLLAIVALPATSNAAPEFSPDEVRILSAVGKFGDTHQVAAAYRLRAPRPLRAHHLELAVGSIVEGGSYHPFVSVGPVWRWAPGSGAQYVDFGFSPTLLSDSRIGGRELGGAFHFTSSLSVGLRFGPAERYAVALRAQHTSNGGLNSDNPGLDLVGLNVSFEF